MQWYKRKNFNSEKIARLSKTLNIPMISSLLLQRGIGTLRVQNIFLDPIGLNCMILSMKDMNKAVDRIL